MRSLVLNFHSGSFLPGASTVSLFSLTSLRPPPALLLASSAVPFPEIAPRHGHRRASFSLVRAASDQEPPPPGEVPEANDAEGTAASGEDEATASAESAEPKPRPDEDVAGDNSSSSSLSEKESTSRQQETEGDWDAAWASTRQKMEQQRKDAPPFSGRKQVVATKIGDGEYDIVEISADGSRQRRGDGAGSGGFGFADNGGERSARGQMMDREQQTVDLATTNKVRLRCGLGADGESGVSAALGLEKRSKYSNRRCVRCYSSIQGAKVIAKVTTILLL